MGLGLKTAIYEAELSVILLVAHVLHPLDGAAVELFLYGEMRHRRRGHCFVPVLLARWKPDHISGADLLDGTAPALHTAAAGGDNQRLTAYACATLCAHRARKVIRWSFARCYGTDSFDFHLLIPFLNSD